MIEIGPNKFKQALKDGKQQVGFWSALSMPLIADMLADCGWDWLMLDTEHSTSGVHDIYLQLLAVDRSPHTTPVVRPVWNDMALFKKYLDIGARSLLVPMVSTVEEAKAAVDATRYPTDGQRGVAGNIRANRYGRMGDYHATASDDICLLVQVETQTGLDNLDDIAAVDGVDGVFIGPADLGAALGHLTDRNHPEVTETIKRARKRIADQGKPSGILAGSGDQGQMWLDEGFSFVAVSVDAGVLVREVDALAKRFLGGR